MDMWVVAAAGAGYLAKVWQSVIKEREGSSGPLTINSSDEKSFMLLLDKDVSPMRPGPVKLKKRDERSVFRRRVRRQVSGSNSPCKEGNSNSSDERLEDNSLIDVSLANGIFSTYGFDSDRGQGSSLDRLDSGTNDCGNTWQPDFSPRSFSMGNGFGRGRNRLNSKWSRRHYSVKPLTALESCVIAQMYKDHVEMEEYAFGSLPSSSNLSMRPFVVTDGNQVISRASKDFSNLQFEGSKQKFEMKDGIDWRVVGTSSAVQPFTKTGLMELPRKSRREKTNAKHGKMQISNISPADKTFHLQGSHDGMTLFCFGVAFGVMTMILSNKREVDNLNELLQQTQNLVQDLQEEIEMKESLTVNELTNDTLGPQEICQQFSHKREPVASLLMQAPNEVTHDETTEGNESISKIEAELEAELERLELNMKANSLERRLSGFTEIDPDLVSDVVHGELKTNMVDRTNYSSHDTSSTSDNDTPPANYAVSPKELSLRLHELVQTQLQERIVELELELEDTKRRLLLMEEKRAISHRDYSNSEVESPPTLGSPTLTEQGNVMLPPVYLNLSGDALNAYNEAYDEFLKMTDINENSVNVADKNKQGHENGSTYPSSGTDTDDNGPFQVLGNGEMASKNPDYDEIGIWERSRDSLEGDDSEEEDYDEFGKMLIEKIVEKTRQGSPVVLNAQKMLLAMDEGRCRDLQQ